jgi:transposase
MTPQEIIDELRRNGYKWGKMLALFGVNDGKARSILESNNSLWTEYKENNNRYGQSITAEQIIDAMEKTKYTHNAAAGYLGVHVTTVVKWLTLDESAHKKYLAGKARRRRESRTELTPAIILREMGRVGYSIIAASKSLGVCARRCSKVLKQSEEAWVTFRVKSYNCNFIRPVDALNALLANSLNFACAAKELGVTKRTIDNMIKRDAAVYRKYKAAKALTKNARMQRLYGMMRGRGCRITDVAKEFGVANSTAMRWVEFARKSRADITRNNVSKRYSIKG